MFKLSYSLSLIQSTSSCESSNICMCFTTEEEQNDDVKWIDCNKDIVAEGNDEVE